jgi:hypothetical protein
MPKLRYPAVMAGMIGGAMLLFGPAPASATTLPGLAVAAPAHVGLPKRSSVVIATGVHGDMIGAGTGRDIGPEGRDSTFILTAIIMLSHGGWAPGSALG